MLLIHGMNRSLPLPFSKRTARRVLPYAQPLEMNIDIVDGVTFPSTAYQIPAENFTILNPRWTSTIEPYLKQNCVGQSLQLNPAEIDLKLSNLILLKSCQFPRRFHWPKSDSIIGKLFLSLPSFYRGGKETISYHREKHTFDHSDCDPSTSSFYTIVPHSDECQHEIDWITHGDKLILVYDILPLTSTVYYHVEINDSTLQRVSRVCEMWLNGLENEYHGYSTKIIHPFSDTFHPGKNLLLSGIDRMIGTILRRMVDEIHPEKFLLYQGIIQPNRSNDGSVHACRSLTQMKLINASKSDPLFQQIDSCLGNCNETYSGNIFLRKIRSEHGNFLPIEQFAVPIWCLVPFDHRYELLLDHLPRVFTHLEENLLVHPDQSLLLIDWLLTTPKKIHFNSKFLLHQLLRLQTHREEFLPLLRKLFEHKKFHEQFFPMTNEEEYEDLISLLNSSLDPQIPLYIHQVFRTVLQRRSRDTERMKDAIQFIGILSLRKVDSSFLLVLIHQLLSYIFKAHYPTPSITDLTNLLALLSLSGPIYQSSCVILSQQILRQIRIANTTTTSISTMTHLLRAVLIPTLMEIYRNFRRTNPEDGKRKRQRSFPSWFLSLYRTCLSLLNSYCESLPPVPIYEQLTKKIDRNCCAICRDFETFLSNSQTLEQVFRISSSQLRHFHTMIKQFQPLIIQTQSMTGDHRYHQIHLMKMSNYDDEMTRENFFLRSLLLNNQFEDTSEMKGRKRFKSSM